MQREEKHFEAALEAMIQRVKETKQAISDTITKLECHSEVPQWPSFLDSYGLISGQLKSLLGVLKNEKTPILRNLVLFPWSLNPERDEKLVQLTEGRVIAFAHDVAPDYLRTRPDPDVEQKIHSLELKSAQVLPDNIHRQVTSMNKLVDHAIETLSLARDEWENDSASRTKDPLTFSQPDTHVLISAKEAGVGLCPMTQTVRPGLPQPHVTQPLQMPGGGKAPSAIKTNIKAATGPMNPYAR